MTAISPTSECNKKKQNIKLLFQAPEKHYHKLLGAPITWIIRELPVNAFIFIPNKWVEVTHAYFLTQCSY